jgi:carboxypeptidase Taq
MPDWKQKIAGGDVKSVINWHIKNIHHKADLYDPPELTKIVTGKEMTAKPFLSYLSEKYSRLFE